MDNLIFILTIFLIAALNTFVVVIIVRLILKIKMDRHKISEEVKKEITPLIKPQTSDLKKPVSLQYEKNNRPVLEEKKKNPVEKIEQPRYLKYTSDGYIKPENDVKKQHIWR
ncbi:MAG: hypothetical protein EHM47_04530 [Ignavibacteriales bacterium]|nr:MAG: hypothetical protein EHM47_04530 [Ignavibacteriales bacterium]